MSDDLERKPEVKNDIYTDNGSTKETKELAFFVGSDGDDGFVSIDILLTYLQEHFPGVSYSDIAITIEREDEIIVFDKRTDRYSYRTQK